MRSLTNLGEPPRDKIVKKVHESKLAFKAMENLKNFIDGCKSLGVPALVCFDTLDVYEKQDIVELVKTLQSLGSAVADMRDYQGTQIASQLLPDGTARREPRLCDDCCHCRTTAASPHRAFANLPRVTNRNSRPASGGRRSNSGGGPGSFSLEGRPDLGGPVPTMFTRTLGGTRSSRGSTSSKDGSDAARDSLEKRRADSETFAVTGEVRAEAMATVAEAFRAEDEKEMSVKKGDIVYVMYLSDAQTAAQAELEAVEAAAAAADGAASSFDGRFAMVKLGDKSGLVPVRCLKGGASDEKIEAVGRGGGHGLDKALALKAAAKYDKIQEAKAQHWVERLLGELCPPYPKSNKFGFFEFLQDGTRLCRLLNRIQPDTVSSFHEAPSGVSKKFQEMENISKFLVAARELGVQKSDLFETVDLYEFKAVGLVLQALYAVSRAALANVEDFLGPFLSDKGVGAAQALQILMRGEVHRQRSRHQSMITSRPQSFSIDREGGGSAFRRRSEPAMSAEIPAFGSKRFQAAKAAAAETEIGAMEAEQKEADARQAADDAAVLQAEKDKEAEEAAAAKDRADKEAAEAVANTAAAAEAEKAAAAAVAAAVAAEAERAAAVEAEQEALAAQKAAAAKAKAEQEAAEAAEATRVAAAAETAAKVAAEEAAAAQAKADAEAAEAAAAKAAAEELEKAAAEEAEKAEAAAAAAAAAEEEEMALAKAEADALAEAETAAETAAAEAAATEASEAPEASEKPAEASASSVSFAPEEANTVGEAAGSGSSISGRPTEASRTTEGSESSGDVVASLPTPPSVDGANAGSAGSVMLAGSALGRGNIGGSALADVSFMASKGSSTVETLAHEPPRAEEGGGWHMRVPEFSLNEAHTTGPRLPESIPRWTDSDFTVDMKKLLKGCETGKVIGQGNFGSVVVCAYEGRKTAVKVQPIPDIYGEEEWAQEILDNLVSELSVLRSCCQSQPYLCDFIGAGRAGNDVYFVMGLARRGDLRVLLEGRNCPGWDKLIRILRDSARGLAALHKSEMMHRDFKTPNILVNEDWSASLCDFGFTIWSRCDERLETCAGTEEFMAPEMELGEDFSLPADLFSLGISICEVATKRRPGERNFLYRSPRNLYAFEPEAPYVYAALAPRCPQKLVKIAEAW